jgi:biopolymer transport protein ExbD
MRNFATLLLFLATIGCSAGGPKLSLPIILDQNGQCLVEFDGRRLSPEAVAKTIMRRANSNTEIIILADRETPYRCIGTAVYVLQGAGVKSVEYKLK